MVSQKEKGPLSLILLAYFEFYYLVYAGVVPKQLKLNKPIYKYVSVA